MRSDLFSETSATFLMTLPVFNVLQYFSVIVKVNLDHPA